MKSETRSSIVGFGIIIVLFLVFSYVIQNNLDYLTGLIGDSFLGMIVYVLLLIIESVVAPISGVPLVPLASNLWGWMIAGVLTLVGWEIGAVLCFLIARRWGIPIVKRLVPIKEVNKLEERISKEHLFWSIVFLRIGIPSDIVSYALGLFSGISLRRYSLATLIGYAPISFVFAYAGTLPFVYQIIAIVVAILIVLLGILFARSYKKIKNSRKSNEKNEK